MSLITPEIGLVFWMVVIFGVVFAILAKVGFPIITRSVEKRSDHIRESLAAAEEARAQLAGVAEEQKKILAEARAEQGRIIADATKAAQSIVQEAWDKASEDAALLLRQAKTQIAAEREGALRDIRREVAVLSVQVAGEVLRKNLSDDASQRELVDRIISDLPETHVS